MTLEAAAPPPDVLAPTRLTQEDIHQLIGMLYLEIDVLRRQVRQLRAYIETNGLAAPAPPP